MSSRLATSSARLPEELRAWAEEQYLVLRRETPPDVALLRIAEVAKQSGQLISPLLLEAWAEDDRWERAFRAAESAKVLASDELRDDVYLKELLSRRYNTKLLLETSAAEAGKPEPVKGAVQRHATMHSLLKDIEQQIMEQQQRMRYRLGEQLAGRHWRDRRQQIKDELRGQYAIKGPQYEILCERLAAAEIRMEQLEDSGAVVDSAEYQKLTSTITDLTNQLQKFTEAQKTEDVTLVNQTIRQTLELVERYLQPRAPTLWDGLVTHIVQQLEGGEHATLPAPVAVAIPAADTP